MLSITKGTTEKEAYFFGRFLTDVAAGAITLIAIIPAALLLGGFSFFAPWLIVTPLLMFAVGMLRGNSAGNIWLKGVSINVSYLLLLGKMLSGRSASATVLGCLLGALIAVLPAIAGISFRRHCLLRSANSTINAQR